MPVPEAGHEVDDGEYVVDLAWPDRRIAVSVEVDDDRDAGCSHTAGRSFRRTRQRYARQWRERADGRDHVQGVPPGLDVDGSMKGKAWDFVTKLGREADLTGLDLKKPKGAADRRVRTARVDHNFRAVLFAVGDENQPMWLLAAIKPHDDAYRHAETLTLTVNPANGAMEVLATEAVREKVAEFRKRPVADDLPSVLPFPVADLVALGLDAEVAAEAVRQTDQDEVLELADDLPEWQQRALLDLMTGTSLDDVRSTYAADEPTLGRRPGRSGDAPHEPHAVRLPRHRRRAAPHDGGRLRRLAHVPAPDPAGRRLPRDLQRARSGWPAEPAPARRSSPCTAPPSSPAGPVPGSCSAPSPATWRRTWRSTCAPC